VEQCEALLRAAENHKRGMLAPYVAVCLFGGLRPFEAMRLTWRQVNLEDNEIRLEAKQTKTGRARVVTIDRTLAKWLQAHRGKEFFPSGWRKNFDAVKLAAGIENWPVDVMRHTAISHFFRECESYGRTAEQFGNSEAIIKAHYQGRVKSAETARFYAILPKGKGNK
jgi:integrase